LLRSSGPAHSILTVREHETLAITERGTSTSLSASEADALERFSGSEFPFFKRLHRSVEFEQYGGVVSLGDRILEILPKIDDEENLQESRATMLRMLRVAGVLPYLSHGQAGQNLEKTYLLEVFIQAFFQAVFSLARGGLIRQYLEEEDELRVVRGKIQLQYQFSRLWNRQDRIACVFDELTADNAWNRLLKLAVTLARSWIADQRLFRKSIELSVLFDDVRSVSVAEALRLQFNYNRQAVRYREAIEWALAIVQLLAPSFRGGRFEAPSLLFNLNHLFEAAVAAQIRRRLAPDLRLFSQNVRLPFGRIEGERATGLIALKPDLVIKADSQCIAIADTKWKRAHVDQWGYITPAPADVYQMYAYAVGFRCADTAVIYPWHSGLADTGETAIALPEAQGIQPKISILCVDVRFEPFVLKRGQGNTVFSRFVDVSPTLAA
jgi:5-methylcytosine-specific restriction enzyme subunit McrC